MENKSSTGDHSSKSNTHTIGVPEREEEEEAGGCPSFLGRKPGERGTHTLLVSGEGCPAGLQINDLQGQKAPWMQSSGTEPGSGGQNGAGGGSIGWASTPWMSTK